MSDAQKTRVGTGGLWGQVLCGIMGPITAPSEVGNLVYATVRLLKRCFFADGNPAGMEVDQIGVSRLCNLDEKIIPPLPAMFDRHFRLPISVPYDRKVMGKWKTHTEREQGLVPVA